MPLKTPVMGIVVNHPTLGIIGGVNTRMTGFQPDRSGYASGVFRCRVRDTPLLQGEYSIDVWLGDGHVDQDTLAGVTRFEIEVADVYNTGAAPYRSLGTVFLRADWELKQADVPDKLGSASSQRDAVLAAQASPENLDRGLS
jgi:lipopolysaccharide transport system ATP-binding protein